MHLLYRVNMMLSRKLILCFLSFFGNAASNDHVKMEACNVTLYNTVNEGLKIQYKSRFNVL